MNDMISKAKVVYWARLQAALTAAGLWVDVSLPEQGYLWNGSMEDMPFSLAISMLSEEEMRDRAAVTLWGQDEEDVIPKLSVFMGYKPFCSYQDRQMPSETVTFEWSRRDSDNRFAEIVQDENFFNLRRFNEGSSTMLDLGMEYFFYDSTPEKIRQWEDGAMEDNLFLRRHTVQQLLPFLREVAPRFGKIQGKLGLSIISLGHRQQNEEAIVQYGLNPLIEANIISHAEEEQILLWYEKTVPIWDLGMTKKHCFKTEFNIGGMHYMLRTDSSRSIRDLNLIASGL